MRTSPNRSPETTNLEQELSLNLWAVHCKKIPIEVFLCRFISFHSRRIRLQPHTSSFMYAFVVNTDIHMSNGVWEGTELSEQRQEGEQKWLSPSFKCVIVCCLFIYVFNIVLIKYLHTCTHIAYHNVAKFTNLLPWKHRGGLSAS